MQILSVVEDIEYKGKILKYPKSFVAEIYCIMDKIAQSVSEIYSTGDSWSWWNFNIDYEKFFHH